MSKAFDKVWHEGLVFKLKTYGIEIECLKLLQNYLADRQQRVLLNGVTSKWENIYAGVPQGSVLGPLLFLIYINDLPDNVTNSTVKMFADDTSIFSIVNCPKNSLLALNSDLKVINDWALQWKMRFNPDPNKQANEVIFSRKKIEQNHHLLTFNDSFVQIVSSQKHLGLILDQKLNFLKHTEDKISKANKGIGLLRKLYYFVPRKTLLSIYKSYIRPHLDYADVIYDQPQNMSFSDRLESVQYNACLAITGAIKGTSRERLYQELGLETLRDRQWYRKLVLFFNIFKGEAPLYLKNLLPPFVSGRSLHKDTLRQFKTKSTYFAGCFFPYCVNEWNKFSGEIREITTISKFKKELLSYIRPENNPIYRIHDPNGLKLLTRLRLGLSHLREHKYKHNFMDTNIPFCVCGLLEEETTEHFLLRCTLSFNERRILLDKVKKNFPSLSNLAKTQVVSTLLYGNENLNDTKQCRSYNMYNIFLEANK